MATKSLLQLIVAFKLILSVNGVLLSPTSSNATHETYTATTTDQFAYDNITCASGKICVINCFESRACYRMNINGVMASELTLNCLGTTMGGTPLDTTLTCFSTNVQCPNVNNALSTATSPICNVNCGLERQACEAVNIVNIPHSYSPLAIDIDCPQQDYSDGGNGGCIGVSFNCKGGYEGLIDLKSTLAVSSTKANGWECGDEDCCADGKYSAYITDITDVYQCTSADCSIDCSASGVDCRNRIIDATQVTSSLIVTCSDPTYCRYGTILGPASSTASVNVSCEGTSSCSYTRISAPMVSSLSVDCLNDDQACSYTRIYGQQVTDLSMRCEGINCDYVRVFGDEVTGNVDITCNARDEDTASLSEYGCENVYTYADSANSVNIICSGYYACRYGIVEANNADTLSITGSDEQSIYYTEFYGANVNAFYYTGIGPTLNSDRDYVINLADFYLPDDLSNVYLDCYGYGCYRINMFTDSIFGYSKLTNIDINLCGSGDLSDVIYLWTLKCPELTSSEVTYSGSSCSSTCNCDDLASTFSAAVTDDSDHVNCGGSGSTPHDNSTDTVIVFMDAMTSVSSWTYSGTATTYNQAGASSIYRTYCPTDKCLKLLAPGNSVDGYIQREVDLSDYTNLCLSYDIYMNDVEDLGAHTDELIVSVNCNDGNGDVILSTHVATIYADHYLKAWGEYVELPTACNGQSGVTIKFAFSTDDYQDEVAYIDSVVLISNPNPSCQYYEYVDPTTNAPTSSPIDPSAITAVVFADAMTNSDGWTVKGTATTTEDHCVTDKCLLLESNTNYGVAYIQREVDLTDYTNLCLSYDVYLLDVEDFGYAHPDRLNVSVDCNDGNGNRNLVTHGSTIFADRDVSYRGQYINLPGACDGQSGVIIKFTFDTDDYRDEFAYIDSVVLISNPKPSCQYEEYEDPPTSAPTSEPIGEINGVAVANHSFSIFAIVTAIISVFQW